LKIHRDIIDIISEKPILLVLLFNAVLYLTGITWGLPHNATWLSDSLAPYHPLVGLSQGFSFGYYHKYPMVHQLILALLNIPIVMAMGAGAVTQKGLSLERLLETAQSPEYVTWLILIDRLVTVIMALVMIYFVYRAARELFSERAAVFAALVASFNTAINFYSHVAKVEVPFLCWAMIALYFLIRVVKYGTRRDYIGVAIFTCLAFGTKDQAYAVFVLPFILFILIFPVLYRKKGENPFRALFTRNFITFAGVFIAGTVIVENLVLNFSGFQKRLGFLLGEGGTRSISYTLEPEGIVALLVDSIRSMAGDTMGWPLLALCAAGILIAVIQNRKNSRQLLLSLVFFIASLSFYLFFVQIIRQSNVRFIMPISLFLTVYGGYAIDRGIAASRGLFKVAFIIIVTASMAYGFYLTIHVNANLLFDTRYRAEEWMQQHMQKDDTIEYYAYEHYLPRFPRHTFTYRVKNDVLDIDERKPDYIVITSHYYRRYLGQISDEVISGRIVTNEKGKQFKRTQFPVFFHKLFNGKLPYGRAARFDYHIPGFKRITFSRLSPDHIIIYKRTE